ncbi:hypothetical protein AURDEDRAFT_131016 [Auricularia subglabra TFB-10046 SS5]|nr:hypothetical protein AURDEDRAFT_131016 [Auricularia subglabra TFB-10046 SS5]
MSKTGMASITYEVCKKPALSSARVIALPDAFLVEAAAHVGNCESSGALCVVQRDPDMHNDMQGVADHVAKSRWISFSTAQTATWTAPALELHPLAYDLRFVRCKTPSIHFHCLHVLLSTMPTSNTRGHQDAGPPPCSPRAGLDVTEHLAQLPARSLRDSAYQPRNALSNACAGPTRSRRCPRSTKSTCARVRPHPRGIDSFGRQRGRQGPPRRLTAGSRKEINDGATGSPSFLDRARAPCATPREIQRESALLLPAAASLGSRPALAARRGEQDAQRTEVRARCRSPRRDTRLGDIARHGPWRRGRPRVPTTRRASMYARSGRRAIWCAHRAAAHFRGRLALPSSTPEVEDARADQVPDRFAAERMRSSRKFGLAIACAPADTQEGLQWTLRNLGAAAARDPRRQGAHFAAGLHPAGYGVRIFRGGLALPSSQPEVNAYAPHFWTGRRRYGADVRAHHKCARLGEGGRGHCYFGMRGRRTARGAVPVPICIRLHLSSCSRVERNLHIASRIE